MLPCWAIYWFILTPWILFIINKDGFIIFIFLRSGWFVISINYLGDKWLHLSPLESAYIKLLILVYLCSFTWFITTTNSSEIFLKLINVNIINQLHFLLLTIWWWTFMNLTFLNLILISVFSLILINHVLHTLCEELFFLILILVDLNYIWILIIVKWEQLMHFRWILNNRWVLWYHWILFLDRQVVLFFCHLTLMSKTINVLCRIFK